MWGQTSHFDQMDSPCASFASYMGGSASAQHHTALGPSQTSFASAGWKKTLGKSICLPICDRSLVIFIKSVNGWPEPATQGGSKETCRLQVISKTHVICSWNMRLLFRGHTDTHTQLFLLQDGEQMAADLQFVVGGFTVSLWSQGSRRWDAFLLEYMMLCFKWKEKMALGFLQTPVYFRRSGSMGAARAEFMLFSAPANGTEIPSNKNTDESA